MPEKYQGHQLTLYKAELKLDPSYMTTFHTMESRKERALATDFSFLEIAAYFGGLIYILYRILCYILRPISQYSFSLKAARHLFQARTSYHTLFLNQDESEKEKQK